MMAQNPRQKKSLPVINYTPVCRRDVASLLLTPRHQSNGLVLSQEDTVLFRTLVAATLALGVTASARASSIVPGTSDPWLAGMPDGSTASFSDSAPAQSPVQALLSFSPGDLLYFSASGSTDHCDFGACGLAGPEGDQFEAPTSHLVGPENGIGDLVAPIDSLIGVFLGPAQPDSSAAPGAVLDFSTLASRDFASLSPLLKQPFFIGDGLRNDATTLQYFIVPAGATRLYLGTMDGYDWFNNVGSLDVTASKVPEPTTIVLVGAGLVGALRRRYSAFNASTGSTIAARRAGR
jgi:hypothetical protein